MNELSNCHFVRAFSDILGINKVCRTKTHRFTSLHLELESAFCPGDELLTNRRSNAGQLWVELWSTAVFVPLLVYIEIPSFVLAQKISEAYKACRGTVSLICNQPASTNE